MESSENKIVELDALIVGAGFSGVYLLKTLRDLGYKVRVVEAGGDYGGVWYWNRYPGARVDIPVPFYQFDDPALWKDWAWTQRFPGAEEIRAYFACVAEKWNLRPDTQFNTYVHSATWEADESRWTIRSKDGDVFKAKFFLPCVGFASKRYIPDWYGIETFRGIFLHPSSWPHEDPDLKGKRVAIVGTGATGIQIAQALAPVVGELIIFQRTPNTALPMGQVDYSASSSSSSPSCPTTYPSPDHTPPPLDAYPALFRGRTSSFSGLDFNLLDRPAAADPPERRRAVFERLWASGDFRYWLAGYADVLSDPSANAEAYRFWRDKTRARLLGPAGPETTDLLAPEDPPYAFGLKRIALEQGFYEIFGAPHVRLVDAGAGGTPVEAVTPDGIRTSDGVVRPCDAIVCATGYDALTGGLARLDVRGVGGRSLGGEHWGADGGGGGGGGVYTYLGMACAGFPNMFFPYGPQAPTPFCNGPSCAQVQGDWIAGVVENMAARGLQTIEAERESEVEWRRTVIDLASSTLMPTTKSWYMGDNIPGKRTEPYIYLGGLPKYYETLCQLSGNGYTGFKLA